MATDAVPQASLDPQFDADLINYDADTSATDKQWSFPDSGVDSAQVSDAKADAADTSSHQPEMTGDSLNEIDWEDHPQPGNDAPPPVPTELGTEESELALNAEPVGAGTHEEGGLEAEQTLADEPSNELDSHELGGGEGAVEHEITYDEDDHAEPVKSGEDDTLNQDVDVDGSGGVAATETEAHAGVEAAKPDDVAEEIEGTGEDDFEVHGSQEDDELDDSAAHDNPSTEQSQDDSGVLPPASLDITVTYKNAEYPLIHGQDNIDTQMGFFEDTSALDLTIDDLLAKFRDELTDDLGPEDEVVLQVDELGLEYAESTHRDHLSGVTLRQLHEIFDQLAKNQEPDVGRTLYTNLVLRPHPAKRLEMLIDEAFNGKGLDEVVYSFQPNLSAHHAHGDEDEEMYESSENEGEQSAEADVEAEDEYVSQDEGDAPAADDGEDEHDTGAQAEYQEDVEAGDDAGDADGDIEHYDEFADLDTTAPPQPPQPQEPIEIPDDANEELDIIEIDGHDLAGSTNQNGGTYDSFNAQQNGVDDINAVDNGGFDLIEIADDDDVVGGAGEAERSATATLAGDGTNEIDFGESDLNDIANADVFLEGASADPANEIDWRDFTEEGESGLKDTLSPSVKRPRPEGDDGEELLSEGQNDVKRRRS